MNPNQNSVTKRRALAYLRISSQRQINGESPETQRQSIQNYANNNGIEIVDTFYDEAKSGKNTERVELQNMLDCAKTNKGKIDYVIVYKMNRASRDIVSYVTGFLIPLRSLGIEIRSATEPIDGSVFGQFMEGLSILVGQMDNQTKQGFTVDNMTNLAYQGYWQHPPIVGYDTHKIQNEFGKTRPTLKPNSKGTLVKSVLERFSQGNITKAELTRFAESIGLRSRYGKPLSEESIHRLIKSSTYAGYISDKFTKYELIEGKHEPIISRDIYEINQKLLYGKRMRKGEVRLKFHPEYPLKGLVRCPNCMKHLYASAPTTGAGGKSPRYHCSRESCKGIYKSIKASIMHEDFEEMLSRIVPNERILSLYKEVLVIEATNLLGNVNTRLARLRTRLNELDSSRLMALTKFTNDQLTLEEKNELTQSIDQDKTVLQDEIRTLESQQEVREVDIEIALSVMKDVSKQWLVASPVNKQRFQSLLFPEGLVYDYELGRFGTSEISPFYRLIANKKGSEDPSKSFLVAGSGFEPLTSWL